MRIAVVGVSGSGKSTLAAALARRLGVEHIELDAINHQPGWRSLNAHDPAEFLRQVELRIADPSWVADGNYEQVRDAIWRRASDLVWLDYDRGVIMRRVIGRSFVRALGGKEIWPGTGNRETFRMWLDPEHPIRWAWDTWSRRRAEYEARVAEPRFAHLRVHRLRHPREAEPLIARLGREVARP